MIYLSYYFTNLSKFHTGPCTDVLSITVWHISWTVWMFIFHFLVQLLSGLVDEAASTPIKFTPTLWKGCNFTIGFLSFKKWVVQQLSLLEKLLRDMLCSWGFPPIFGRYLKLFEDLVALSARTALRVSFRFGGSPILLSGCAYQFDCAIIADLSGGT